MAGKDPGPGLPEAGTQMDLLVLAVHRSNIVARLPGEDARQRVVLRRSWDLWELTEGWLATVDVGRCWIFGSSVHICGTLVDQRLDVAAWGLPPLGLLRQGQWTPRTLDRQWADWAPGTTPPWKDPEAEPVIRTCFQEIMASGPRTVYEMEQVLPGLCLDTWDGDPIIEAVDAWNAGDLDGAHQRLQDCLLADLRCTDAHVHLGLFASEVRPAMALRHYQVGIAVGDHALGPEFQGLLPWNLIDNRPFLRAIHGAGLCHWMLGGFDAASRLFRRLLWLDPDDRLGASGLLARVENRIPYHLGAAGFAGEDDY